MNLKAVSKHLFHGLSSLSPLKTLFFGACSIGKNERTEHKEES